MNKVLILGNSVTLHGPAENIGWKGNWGMAASSRDKDFAHVLLAKMTKAAQGEPQLSVQNLADFERKQTDFDFAAGLTEAVAFQADLIIIAVGANAPELTTDEAKQKYRTAFERLLREVQREKKSTIYVRGEFWHQAAKEDIMREVCTEAGGVYVPLEGLDRDPSNLGSSEQKFEHAGVGGHPGDKGMQKIADAIWTQIEANSK